MPDLQWRDATDDELHEFDVRTSVDRIGDPDETPDWYTLHEYKRLVGYGPGGGAIVHADWLVTLVWTTTSDDELHAAWRELKDPSR